MHPVHKRNIRARQAAPKVATKQLGVPSEIKLSKGAKALLQENEIPLEVAIIEIDGTGKGGNITQKDVKQYLK